MMDGGSWAGAELGGKLLHGGCTLSLDRLWSCPLVPRPYNAGSAASHLRAGGDLIISLAGTSAEFDPWRLPHGQNWTRGSAGSGNIITMANPGRISCPVVSCLMGGALLVSTGFGLDHLSLVPTELGLLLLTYARGGPNHFLSRDIRGN